MIATKLPKVSIVTPSYNQGQFIEATIQSVLGQTYKNIEYILVDGKSTDETMAVVDRYRDKIDIVIHEKDRGQSDAINKGFRAATGDLVGWINSDDLLHADCVEQIVRLYQQHQDGSIYYGSRVDWIDGKGNFIETRQVTISGKSQLLTSNYDVMQPGSFYPTELIQRVGYVDESIHYCMDLDLWLRLLNHGPIYYYSDKSSACYRRWEATKTSTGGHLFLRDIRQVLRKHGATPYSKATLKTRYRAFKSIVKATLSQ
ncbi:glycosyltransferase family 2 protein [Spirosoma agri]|uniref:Glycosyltransferase n=1 Tax=Spirosoma agri TaxID=1987381 RepID=A0A6M0ILX6_9BACT|nr:glycosyltransferase family 2 protein [Spirosoma agri]NEU69329.1 glycosyltransferase [Spirosoma agri]